jgi:hypothetical protein
MACGQQVMGGHRSQHLEHPHPQQQQRQEEEEQQQQQQQQQQEEEVVQACLGSQPSRPCQEQHRPAACRGQPEAVCLAAAAAAAAAGAGR